jgi:3-hydroxyisobutyrate dehydrogenase/glyoxylate/succinic semialdehyde reductase
LGYISYLLRLWQESGKEGELIWRASLESPHTGKQFGFANLEQLFEFLLDSPITAPFLKNKRSKMESGEYDVEFPLQWMQKDLHMASIAGFESNAALPLGNAAKELYKLAMRSGYGEEDFSAIYQFLYEEWDVE